jgi:hypothetical protein
VGAKTLTAPANEADLQAEPSFSTPQGAEIDLPANQMYLGADRVSEPYGRKIAIGGISGLRETPPALPEAVKPVRRLSLCSLQPEVMTSPSPRIETGSLSI